MQVVYIALGVIAGENDYFGSGRLATAVVKYLCILMPEFGDCRPIMTSLALEMIPRSFNIC